MPSAIVGAIAAVGASIGGAAGAFAIMYAEGIASALVIGGTLAASAVQGQQARAKAKNAYNASQRDREVMIRSAVAPRRIVLGRDRVSGPVVYAQSTGTKGEFLHLVIALADGECDAIETIYFNDVALPDPDGSGFITSGEFSRTTVQPVGVSGAMTSGSGTLTLSGPATRITSVATTWTGIDGPAQTIVTGWSHTAGSATITGLPASTQVDVTAERDVGESRVRVKKHLGQAGQVADADLVAESGGKWTSAHIGAGVCYLYVRLQYDPDIFGQLGVPNISCVIRGRKLYDPRTGTTVWSDNAALCAAFLLRAPEGFNAAAAEVPDAETIAGANVCDETVALDGLGATQKRYICNASIVADVSPRDAMADVLSTMAGTAVWTQGRWLVRPGAYRTPTLTLTEDYLAGAGVSIIPKTSRSDLFNAVRATYRDPSQGWAEVQAPLVTNAGYEAADGGVRIVRNIRIAGAMDAMRAQRLAKIELERERQALTVQLSTSLRGYNLSPTDTVALTLARYGFAGKSFEVRQRAWSAEGVLDYTLRETAAGVWAWNYGEATVGDLAPDTVLPSPYTRPAALVGLSVESGTVHLLRLADGTVIARAWLQWTQSAEVFVLQGGRIEVQWQPSGATDWQVAPALPGDAINTYLQPMPDGRAVVYRVRAVNASGRSGDWSNFAAVVVGKTAPPSNVAGLAASVVVGGARLSWTPPTDVDYAETELRVGGADWAGGVRLFRGKASEFPWLAPAVATHTVRAKHFDDSGNESVTAASIGVTISASGGVSWTDLSGRPQLFRARAQGYSDTTYTQPWANLLNAETDTSVFYNPIGRSYMVARINRSDGSVAHALAYDVYGSSTERDALVSLLNGSGPQYIVVVFTYDEPQANRLGGGLDAAIYRCGASRAVFGSPQFKARAAYVLVGIGGCGEGNGYEAYSGSVDNDTNAWCDVAFTVQSGQLIVSGNAATPRTLADYSYVGDLDATKGAPAGTNVAGMSADTLVSTATGAASDAAAAQSTANTANTNANTANTELANAPTASISGGDLVVNVANGGAAYGTRTITGSAGTTPYTYAWTLSNFIVDGAGTVWIVTGTASATVSISGKNTNGINTCVAACVMTDARGRTVTKTFAVSGTHGTPI